MVSYTSRYYDNISPVYSKNLDLEEIWVGFFLTGLLRIYCVHSPEQILLAPFHYSKDLNVSKILIIMTFALPFGLILWRWIFSWLSDLNRCTNIDNSEGFRLGICWDDAIPDMDDVALPCFMISIALDPPFLTFIWEKKKPNLEWCHLVSTLTFTN